jgi:hypothetical protein
VIIVFTSIIGAWDNLRSPEVIEPGVRYVCYSDVPRDPVAPWEIQPAYCPFDSAGRNARISKILPHLHFDAEYSIYHDANFVLRGYPSHIVAEHLVKHDIAMFQHPCRRHIGEEDSCLRDLHTKGELPGLEGQLLAAQVSLWKHHGAPLGLWAGGFIVRRHSAAVRELNETWWQLFRDGCTRDQISFPLARHITGVEVNTLKGNIYECAELAFHWHAAWKHKGDNPKYATRQAELDCKRRRLVELAQYPVVRA